MMDETVNDAITKKDPKKYQKISRRMNASRLNQIRRQGRKIGLRNRNKFVKLHETKAVQMDIVPKIEPITDHESRLEEHLPTVGNSAESGLLTKSLNKRKSEGSLDLVGMNPNKRVDVSDENSNKIVIKAEINEGIADAEREAIEEDPVDKVTIDRLVLSRKSDSMVNKVRKRSKMQKEEALAELISSAFKPLLTRRRNKRIKRFQSTSSANEWILTDDVPEPVTTTNDDVQKDRSCDVISSDNVTPSTSHPSNTEEDKKRACCLSGCLNTETASLQVGEGSNIASLIVCTQHRHYFKIVQEIETTPSATVLGNNQPIPVQRIQPTVLSKSNDHVEMNEDGHKLIYRKCTIETTGLKRTWIVERWNDGSIHYNRAPPGLPLGNCTKEQIEFYKMREKRGKVLEQSTKPQETPSTSPSHAPLNPSQLLSIKPPVTGQAQIQNPVRTATTSISDNGSVSQKPYVQQTFLIKKLDGTYEVENRTVAAAPQTVHKVQKVQIIRNPDGKITVRELKDGQQLVRTNRMPGTQPDNFFQHVQNLLSAVQAKTSLMATPVQLKPTMITKNLPVMSFD